MRLVTLRHSKIIFAAFVQTSALCGFAIYRFGYCLPLWSACRPAFHRSLSDGELIGSIAAFAGSSLPSGWLLCDGSAISRTTYSALFSAVGTTYGAGNGSTTFNVPNLVDKFIEGAATSGTVKAAGLPNITGSFTVRPSNSAAAILGTTTGAMELGTADNSSWYINCTSQSAQKVAEKATFNASRSSSVYGNSSTVQPPALTMQYAIYTGNVGKYCWLRTV